MTRSQLVSAAVDEAGGAASRCVDETFRLIVGTAAADRWRVGRELRMRLVERFAAEACPTPPPPLGIAAPGTGPL